MKWRDQQNNKLYKNLSRNLVNRSTNWYQKRMLEMFCLELFNLQNASTLLYDWSLVFYELQIASRCREFNLDSIDEFTQTLVTLIFDIDDKHIFSIIYFFKHIMICLREPDLNRNLLIYFSEYFELRFLAERLPTINYMIRNEDEMLIFVSRCALLIKKIKVYQRKMLPRLSVPYLDLPTDSYFKISYNCFVNLLHDRINQLEEQREN